LPPSSPPRAPLAPSTTLFRSTCRHYHGAVWTQRCNRTIRTMDFYGALTIEPTMPTKYRGSYIFDSLFLCGVVVVRNFLASPGQQDRKSTRLNSSHVSISYAVF